MDVKSVKDALNTHVKLKGSDADYLFTGNGNSVTIARLEDVEGINT